MHRAHTIASLVVSAAWMGVCIPAFAAPESRPAISAAELSNVTPLAHVETRGTGPVHIILIPGVGFDWTVFESFMDRNKERYTMHAVTLPGFGGSTPPAAAEGSTWEDGAWLQNAEKAVLQFVEQKQPDKPVIAGHALGGHIAIRLAAHYPERFRSAIAIDGFPALAMDDPDKPSISQEDRVKLIKDFIEPQFAKDDFATMQGKMLPSMVTDASRAEALGRIAGKVPSPTLVRYTLEGAASDMTPALKDLKIPLLVIAAIPDDAVVPDPLVFEGMRTRTIAMMKGAPNASLVFFENTRHFVTEDAPKELDAAFAAFVDGKDVQGKPRT